MRKITLAMGLAAGCTLGWAQNSNVVLYGIADAGVRHASGLTASNAASPGSITALNSGILSASRWGIRGSENLGGSLKADFNLESAIALDTGSQGNSARYFDRASWIGLSGDWGQLRAGRQTNLLADAIISVDPFSLLIAALNPNVGIAALNQHGLGVQFGNSGQATAAYRLDNSLKYTHNWGRVGVSLMHGFGEVSDKHSALSSSGGLLRYGDGGLTVTMAYQRFNSAASSKLDAMTAGAAYRMGSVTLMGNYARHKARISDASDTVQRVLTLGAKYHATEKITLTAAHYKMDRDRAGLRADGYGRSLLLAEYRLSPRTRAYAEADFTNWRNGYQGAGNKKHATGTSLGMVHTF